MSHSSTVAKLVARGHESDGAAMTSQPKTILAVNGGSSSVRFALYAVDHPARTLLSGKIERIGQPGTRMVVTSLGRDLGAPRDLCAPGHTSAARHVIAWLRDHAYLESIVAVGHRVVHGMQHTEPARVTPSLLDELHRITPCDPEHLALELSLIAAFEEARHGIVQVACFDTAFHARMPLVARLLPIPRRFNDQGVRRYGFHGLSYAYLMGELARLGDPAAAHGRVILAHLGSGSSMAAVRDGESLDTSMGFTPLGGLMMGTRSGDLDPGLAAYLSRTAKLTAEQFVAIATNESGLLGVSGTSADIRDLLAAERTDARASEAVALFCYLAKKCIGSFAAALGGLDTLVFAGGIGENSPPARARICEGLAFLGVELDEKRNGAGAPVVSHSAARVVVRVIATDEEQMIARCVASVLRTA